MTRWGPIAAFVLCLAGGAHAATPIALDAICVEPDGPQSGSDRTVNPLLLTYLLLKGVNPLTIDRDANGTIPHEAFEALIDSEYCAREAPFACAAGDKDKLTEARNSLATFFTDHPGITFTWKRAPTSAELKAETGLDDMFTRTADPEGRFVEMRCEPKIPSPPGPPPEIAERKKRTLGFGRFLLARDLAGLTAARGDPGERGRLDNVPEAEISYIDDNANKTRTLSVTAAAGLKIVDRLDFKLIPYAALVRSHVKDTNGGADTDSGALSLGALFTFMPTDDDQIDISPIFTRNLETHSKILGGRISWRPGFLYHLRSFQGGGPLVCERTASGSCQYKTTTLGLWTDLQFVSSFGRVLNPGNDPKLTDGRNFVRLGPDARLTVYGIRPPFRDFSFDIAYRRLFRLSGDGKTIGQFRTGISYWIAGSEHVALRYGYEKGTDEQTLVRFDLWRLGLGVRF